MPSRFLVALPKEDIVEESFGPESPGLSFEERTDTSDGNPPPTSPNQLQSDTFAELLDVDADKENVPPVETGLLLSAPLTCDEELSKTIATPFLAVEFEQLGISSSDEEEPKSDSEEVAGMGDESSSGEEEDEPLVERHPQVLSLIIGHKDRLALKKSISMSTLSSQCTSEFGWSRCNSPTVIRPRNSAGSTRSRIVGRRSEDCTKWGHAFTFDDWEETKSATPLGAVLPLPPQETLDVEVLAVTESPSPLAQTELPAEDLNAVRSA